MNRWFPATPSTRFLLFGCAVGLVLAAQDARAAGQSDGQSAGQSDAALIAHGKYLADAGDCVACHSAPGGTPFAGGLYMNTPFGPISTPNITPDRDTGIGKMTDDQFYRVFHQGIGMQGERLYPVMPFPWYTKVRRDDVLAIKAYLFSLPPVHAPRKPLKLEFPFNIRAGLIGWDTIFLKDGTFKPDPHQSEAINRGAYLVQGLGHCGECHNGNNMLGDTQMAQALRGGPTDKWYAPNITSDTSQGVGRYSDAQLFQYLKTGNAPGMGVVVGPMAQTVHESLSKLTDADLHDIVAYLKSTPSKEGFKPEKLNPKGAVVATNAQSYLNYCASCHGQDGKGVAGSVPNLAGNNAVAAQGPDTVIRVVLSGINAQGSYSPMPAIGARMTDQEVAEAVNYVRSAWGNNAPATAGGGKVAALRAVTKSMLAFNLPGGCPKPGNDDVAKVASSPAAQKLLAGTDALTMTDNADALIALVKSGAPKASQADVINGLAVAYCPVVAGRAPDAADKALNGGSKSELLDEFAERVYTEITTKGS
jgi:mono/diheme cytochrome c family protein